MILEYTLAEAREEHCPPGRWVETLLGRKDYIELRQKRQLRYDIDHNSQSYDGA